MAFYHRLGAVPHKRHIQFRQPNDKLYHEELVSSIGFDGIYSLMYHIYPPTRIKQMLEPIPCVDEIANLGLQPIHLKTSISEFTGKDFLDARQVLMMNSDCKIAICNPENFTTDYFYKNGEADEVIYMHDGDGWLISPFGKLRIRKGDYVVIPRTTIYRVDFDPLVHPRMLIVESRMPIETVGRYRNELGQLLEHSPYCERDIHPPTSLLIEEEPKECVVYVKKQGAYHRFLYDTSVLDVVGWDGFLYPYTFSIYDFEPITGRLHMPPPIHQTFQSRGCFVICSFVPRLYDYHPLSVPAPYNHSNIDSDEVLFYAEGHFMSRKGIDRGSFTLHPGGLPHGPHPGTMEASLGKAETKEYAVMVDTFKPLHVTQKGLMYLDKDYPFSWL